MSSRPARAAGAHVSSCDYCGRLYGKHKHNFLTRTDAKRAMRRDGVKRGGGLHPYRCPSESGYWHIGHRQAEYVNGGEPPKPAVAQISAMYRATHHPA